MKHILNNLIDTLLPSLCPGCDARVVEYPLPICSNCRIEILNDPAPPEISLPEINTIFSCRRYHGSLKECLKEFKYKNNQNLMPFLKDLLTRSFPSHIMDRQNTQLIIPVPIHKKRKRKRGFNQSEKISAVISKMSSIPVHRDILIKDVNTPPQTGLSKKERMKNIEKSFSITGPDLISGKKILLVDDVMTTGATLKTCARTLLAAGAKEIHAFTLARTMKG